ncbi:MAG: 2,3-bisphosphoglycerate-independent phosphoglycerate mutase, partial [Candidatus Eremiobacteraeota bacterium]|nr:2,3-bisphosphoglycerate-independent phosphoglycerate mutase [Candidatus Eremiobacteraeota bacterium]
LSDGQVHSSIAHLFALVDAGVDAAVPIAIACFLDGRDTPPRSAPNYVAQLEQKLDQCGRQGAIASVCGRYYAMDRDRRWERTKRAYDMLVFGITPDERGAQLHALTAADAVRSAYERGEDDEFVQPTTVGEIRTIDDGDACIFFNFRPDRARQLTMAFNGAAPFPIKPYHDLTFATMTKYEENFPNPVLFGPRPQYDTFGEVVSRAGLHQLRLAETEKYAHVTYFFNGGREERFEGEDRELIPSDRSVPTYDLAPAMRAREITDAALKAIESGTYDVIVMNYANADMVGHTGKWEPTIEAVEVLDECLARLAAATLAADGLLAITADHGNAEEKLDAQGSPLTAHTTNPVPLLLIADGMRGRLRAGKLGDVAPTLLEIMGLPIPERMTGKRLLE